MPATDPPTIVTFFRLPLADATNPLSTHIESHAGPVHAGDVREYNRIKRWRIQLETRPYEKSRYRLKNAGPLVRGGFFLLALEWSAFKKQYGCCYK
jgi:hypothetical protein